MRKRVLGWGGVIALVAILLLTLLAGCQGSEGPAGLPGTPGAPGTGSGTISGKVTNSLTGAPISGVAVSTTPTIEGVTINTDAAGSYSATVPIGSYTLNFKKDGFGAASPAVTLVAGQTVTQDVALKPTSPVAVNAGKAQTASPGATVTLSASAEPLDGSTVTGYQWTQIAGVPAKLADASSAKATVTLGDAAAYKAELLTVLKPMDRFTVLGISPHALEEAEIATFQVTATTSSGKYKGTVTVQASLPYVANTGLRNVPVGLPVLLHAQTATQATKKNPYAWTLTSPKDSKASLDASDDQNPSFTPDVVGKYTLTETLSGAKIDVYAGTWSGVITGQNAKGRPLAEGCTGCHNGTIAPDKFTPWQNSGHAEIVTQNLNNPAGHWTTSCAGCHTVGYDTNATNNGFDEAAAAEGWKAPSHGEVGYWTKMLAEYPKTAKLANIQCENCHGPNNGSTLHPNNTIDAARVSLSSDVCGACHGEPPSHGRFQQWQESGHGGIESTVTPERATSSSCARCHSVQGFLTWLKQGDLTKQIQGAKGNATAAEMTALGFTADKLEPVTCVACHDPHAQGTKSGEPNSATVRITGDTAILPAGFGATEVGKGALCITCHNTRNALHNDAYPPTSYSAPHTAAQADVLMGENAYFVSASQRSPHSYIKDTCVTCHLEETPPPAEFSRNLAGTNHAFSASIGICASCHSSTLDGKALQAGVEEKAHKLGAKMAAYLLSKMPAQITIKDYTPHTWMGTSYDVLSDAVVVNKTNIASLEPTEPHGQQGFFLHFTTPVAVTYKPAGEDPHTISITVAEVRVGDITTDGKTVLIPFTDALVKAGWNYFLIEGDDSWGVHNPAFANAVLDATIAALK